MMCTLPGDITKLKIFKSQRLKMFISYYVNFQLSVKVCQMCAFLDLF